MDVHAERVRRSLHRLRRHTIAFAAISLGLLAVAVLSATGAGAQDLGDVPPVSGPSVTVPPDLTVPPIDVAPVDGSPPTTVLPVEDVEPVPDVSVTISSDDQALSRSVLIVLLLTIGSVAPAILLLMTSFTRFVIVLGLTRNALGAQGLPPTQVLIGLSLFLTFFVMAPVLKTINENALQPLLAGEMEQGEAFQAAYEPLQEFMLAQADDDDIALFLKLSDSEQPETRADLSPSVLIPAFVVGELRAAFTIGFVIFIPFLVIDLVIASVLMSMGMVMLPPVFISLPLKLLLFVMVDGWGLIIGSVVDSVHGVGS